MTDKLISLQAAKTALSSCTILEWEQLKKCYPMLEVLEELPSAQPTQTNTSKALETLDCISRRAAIAKFEPWLKVEGYSEGELNMLKAVLFELTVMPPAKPEPRSSSCGQENDMISRQMLLEYIHGEPVGKLLCDKYNLDGLIEQFPSAQLDFDITAKIDKAYDDGYEAGYLQGRHDWGDLDE